jgi:hypothetical protein
MEGQAQFVPQSAIIHRRCQQPLRDDQPRRSDAQALGAHGDGCQFGGRDAAAAEKGDLDRQARDFGGGRWCDRHSSALDLLAAAPHRPAPTPVDGLAGLMASAIDNPWLPMAWKESIGL